MTRHRSSRSLAFFLTLILGLPPPAFALRETQKSEAGLEDLVAAFHPSPVSPTAGPSTPLGAGAEEDKGRMTRRGFLKAAAGVALGVTDWGAAQGATKPLPSDALHPVFSPDKTRAVYVTKQNVLVIWDARAGKPIKEYRWEQLPSPYKVKVMGAVPNFAHAILCRIGDHIYIALPMRRTPRNPEVLYSVSLKDPKPTVQLATTTSGEAIQLLSKDQYPDAIIDNLFLTNTGDRLLVSFVSQRLPAGPKQMRPTMGLHVIHLASGKTATAVVPTNLPGRHVDPVAGGLRIAAFWDRYAYVGYAAIGTVDLSQNATLRIQALDLTTGEWKGTIAFPSGSINRWGNVVVGGELRVGYEFKGKSYEHQVISEGHRRLTAGHLVDLWQEAAKGFRATWAPVRVTIPSDRTATQESLTPGLGGWTTKDLETLERWRKEGRTVTIYLDLDAYVTHKDLVPGDHDLWNKAPGFDGLGSYRGLTLVKVTGDAKNPSGSKLHVFGSDIPKSSRQKPTVFALQWIEEIVADPKAGAEEGAGIIGGRALRGSDRWPQPPVLGQSPLQPPSGMPSQPPSFLSSTANQIPSAKQMPMITYAAPRHPTANLPNASERNTPPTSTWNKFRNTRLSAFERATVRNAPLSATPQSVSPGAEGVNSAAGAEETVANWLAGRARVTEQDLQTMVRATRLTRGEVQAHLIALGYQRVADTPEEWEKVQAAAGLEQMATTYPTVEEAVRARPEIANVVPEWARNEGAQVTVTAPLKVWFSSEAINAGLETQLRSVEGLKDLAFRRLPRDPAAYTPARGDVVIFYGEPIARAALEEKASQLSGVIVVDAEPYPTPWALVQAVGLEMAQNAGSIRAVRLTADNRLVLFSA